MSKIKNLNSYREGTVESIVENLKMAMDKGLVKDIVFVAINQETEEVVHGCNDMNALKAIGLLEIGKTQIIDNTREED